MKILEALDKGTGEVTQGGQGDRAYLFGEVLVWVSNGCAVRLKYILNDNWCPVEKKEVCVCKTKKPGSIIYTTKDRACVECGEIVTLGLLTYPIEEKCEVCEREKVMGMTAPPVTSFPASWQAVIYFLLKKEHTCKKGDKK